MMADDAKRAGNERFQRLSRLPEDGTPDLALEYLESVPHDRKLYPGDHNLEGETLLLLASHDLDRGRADAALAKLEKLAGPGSGEARSHDRMGRRTSWSSLGGLP
jgi:hypothetical protein